MIAEKIRIYCESYEQGLYLKSYIDLNDNYSDVPKELIYTKGSFSSYENSSIIARIKKYKDFDALISVITLDNKEIPISVIEFSNSVPTDDHKLQRYDFIFWSAFHNIPSIKISPSEMYNTNFGGGNIITINHEYHAVLQMNGIYYHINIPLIPNTDYAMVDEERISCPPYLNDLKIILDKFLTFFNNSNSITDFYNQAFDDYKLYVETNFENRELAFNNSSRYQFTEDGALTLKVNRFGHGMDPEKGAICFWGTKYVNNLNIKFEIQRNTEQKYKSLYEGCRENIILPIVNDIFNNHNNEFDFETAFQLFKIATNTEGLFSNSEIENNIININDEDLRIYVLNGSSVINLLLKFGHKIILTNLDGSIILEIHWNNNFLEEYYNLLKASILNCNYIPLPLREYTNSEMSEDLVTYANVEIFKLNNMINISASYPGAQGDRKILVGATRNVLREYYDVISLKRIGDNTYDVIIQENKHNISSSVSDIEKLNTLITSNERKEGLANLINTVFSPININSHFIGIGGKQSNINYTRINYIMVVELLPNYQLKWAIITSEQRTFAIFRNLLNSDMELRGSINIFPIYKVD